MPVTNYREIQPIKNVGLLVVVVVVAVVAVVILLLLNRIVVRRPRVTDRPLKYSY